MHVILKCNAENKGLTPNTHYLVYALKIGINLSICIQLERFPSAPSFLSGKDFEISDSRLSKHWIISEKKEAPYIVSFKEWANNELFYDDLVDSKNNAGAIWRKYKAIMEREFAPPDLEVSSTHMGDDWYKCFDCLNIWQPGGDHEVLVCAECGKVQRRHPISFQNDM